MEKIQKISPLKSIITKILLISGFIVTFILSPIWILLIWKKLNWSKKIKWTTTVILSFLCFFFVFMIIVTLGTPTFDKIKSPTNQSPITLSVQSAFKNAKVSLYQNDLVIKELNADVNGRFSTNVDLKEGDNRFKAISVNEKGKVRKSSEFNVFYDITPPKIVLKSQEKIETETNKAEIKGETEKSSEVIVYNTEKQLNKTKTSSGNFNLEIKDLKEGENNLFLKARDEAGNVGEQKDVIINYTPKLIFDQELVTRIVDGDTIETLATGKIRLIGVDTPETVDPRKTVQCFGKEASDKAREMLSGKNVRLEKDPTQGDKDIYNRALRYVYLEDGTLFNKWLVENGYAHEYTYIIPYKYQQDFKNAEKSARENNRGFWAPESCNGNTEQSTSNTNNNTPPPVQTTQPAPTTQPPEPQATPPASSESSNNQPPPTTQSGCDPNYSGACVPIASDVDCAGGTGNGPAYVQGHVNVIGQDIYKLDRDGDGVGCN